MTLLRVNSDSFSTSVSPPSDYRFQMGNCRNAEWLSGVAKVSSSFHTFSFATCCYVCYRMADKLLRL